MNDLPGIGSATGVRRRQPQRGRVAGEDGTRGATRGRDSRERRERKGARVSLLARDMQGKRDWVKGGRGG